MARPSSEVLLTCLGHLSGDKAVQALRVFKSSVSPDDTHNLLDLKSAGLIQTEEERIRLVDSYQDLLVARELSYYQRSIRKQTPFDQASVLRMKSYLDRDIRK